MLLALYILTLVVPLIMSFFLDDMNEGEEFFSLFSLNKVLVFLSGFLLGLLGDHNPVVCILSGLAHLGVYILVMRLIKTLEYTGKKAEVSIGDTGMVYSTVDDSAAGKVLIAGELHRAVPYNSVISSFTPVKVVGKVPNSEILIVDVRL